MKADMAGAASIMAVLRGAAEFSLDVNIDAEGRLIIADASALRWVEQYGQDTF